MKKIFKFIAASCLMASVLSGCVGKFEEYNTNPYNPTPEQMFGDAANVGSSIRAMQAVLVQGQENKSQHIDQMIGSEYGGHTACIAQWGNAGNFYTYNPRIGWKGVPYDEMMPQIYTNYYEISKLTEKKGVVYHWAQILRVYGSYLLNGMYGPIPYSQVEDGKMFVGYDSEEALFNNMFAELEEAIYELTPIVLSGEDTSILAEYDYVYNGSFTKWIKFANTLKLRMAMRISNVAPELAQTKAEEAVSHPIGVLTSDSDAAWSSIITTNMNPYYIAEVEWNGGEIRLSANVQSYLQGYGDPRLEKYAKKADLEGDYAEYGILGVRNGIYQNASSMAAYQQFSCTTIAKTDKLLVMPASEAYFLRAEGALKGWNMGGTAKQLYEEGVQVSMNERGVSVGNYLSKEAVPAEYTDPYSSTTIAAVSSVCPKYDESASDEVNLERILVQKWIASFPNGWERWGDFRRTGYPKMFPVVDNENTDGVSKDRGMRRIPYSENEGNTNSTNLAAAVALLGGPDTGATDLWWAKKN